MGQVAERWWKRQDRCHRKGQKMRKSGKRRNEGKKGTGRLPTPPCRQKPADTELSLVDKGVRRGKNSRNPFDHRMLLKPPLPTMPGHLRERIFQLSQGHSPEFSCRNRLSNPFGSGLLDLVPPTLLSQFWMSQFKRRLVSLFSTKAFLMGVSRGRLEANRAQGRTKNDLSKRRVPLRQSGKLCYQLTVIRTEAQRYQVSAQANTGQDCCSPPPYGHPAGQNLSGVLRCQEHTSVCCTVKTHLDLLAPEAPLVLP